MKPMKSIFIDHFCSALPAVIIGVVLLIWPGLSNTIICYGIAAACLLYGFYRIACYFRRDKDETILRRDLTMGLVSVAVGIFVLARTDIVVSILPVLFALTLIVGAMGAVQTAFDLRRLSGRGWFVSLILAAIFLILGIIILKDPFSTAIAATRFIGISLLIEGACALATSAVLSSRSSK